MDEITEGMIQKALNKLNETKSEDTVRGVNTLIKTVLTQAVNSKIIEENPYSRGVKLPTFRKAEKENVLDDITMTKLLTAIEHSDVFKPIIILLLYTGIRIGELLALKWNDVDFNNNVLKIRRTVTIKNDYDDEGNIIKSGYIIGYTTKTKASIRDIPLDSKVVEVLNEWKQKVENDTNLMNLIHINKTEDMVFVNSKGGITKYYTLRNNFNRFCEANDLGDKELNFHKFRHTFCTKLAENNVSIAIAQSLMGHSDPTMTLKIYTHGNMKMKNIGIEAIKNAYNKIS